MAGGAGRLGKTQTKQSQDRGSAGRLVQKSAPGRAGETGAGGRSWGRLARGARLPGRCCPRGPQHSRGKGERGRETKGLGAHGLRRPWLGWQPRKSRKRLPWARGWRSWQKEGGGAPNQRARDAGAALMWGRLGGGPCSNADER